MILNKPYTKQQYIDFIAFCNNNNCSPVDKGGYLEAVEIITPPPTVDEIKSALIAGVQNHLDKKCQELGYDNGFACASYATSSVPKFKQEAEAYVLWRDQVWTYCYEQLALFEAGEREVPALDELIAELPVLGNNLSEIPTD